MRAAPRWLLAATGLVLTACASGGQAATPGAAASAPPTGGAVTYTLPGDRVFPEGVGVDKATGDFYAGSSEDGTVYRGTVGQPGEAEVFLEPGVDGRDAATGIKVFEGRLFVAGRGTGRLFVHDAETGELIRALETPGEPGLVNDLTFAGGAAYVTDSFRPVVYRVPLTADGVGDIEPWLDLTGTPIEYGDGFNLNGISASDDGRHLLTVHTGTGELWRIDVETQAVEQVDLGGASLTTGDGLLLDGRTLYAVRNSPGVVLRIELSEDLRSGEVTQEIADPSFRYPTTLAEYDGQLLVVNSQFGAGDSPDLPFTVSGVPYPGATRP